MKKIAASVAVLICTTAANAAPLPKEFLGKWCLSSSIVNGWDNLNKEYVPRTNVFVRGRCVEDKITVRRNGLLMADGRVTTERTCKTRRVTREDYGPNEPIYYLVRYRCNSGPLTALMLMRVSAMNRLTVKKVAALRRQPGRHSDGGNLFLQVISRPMYRGCSPTSGTVARG
jgi:hypothetical protein